MPLHYVDSSALVKRYVPEVGSGWIARLCDAEPVPVSVIVISEIASALARRTREGALSVQQRDTLFRLFVQDAGALVVVDLNQTIVQQAAGILLGAPAPVRLRTLDALHLASALWTFALARRRGLATGSFVSADRALLQAAGWAGLSVVNPEDHP